MAAGDRDEDDPVRPKLPTMFNRGNAKRPRIMRGRAVRKTSRKMEARARWIVNEFVRDPTYTYAEMIDAVCERFAIGHSQAEQAYQRAGQLEAEMLGTLSPGKLVGLYFQLLDEARAAGKFNAARAIIDSIFDKTGMSAPNRHEFSMANARTIHQMAHVNVLAMTPQQRAQRKRELVGKRPVLDIAADDLERIAVPARPEPDDGDR